MTSEPIFDDALCTIRQAVTALDSDLQREIETFKLRVASASIDADGIPPSAARCSEWTSNARVDQLIFEISILKKMLFRLLCEREKKLAKRPEEMATGIRPGMRVRIDHSVSGLHGMTGTVEELGGFYGPTIKFDADGTSGSLPESWMREEVTDNSNDPCLVTIDLLDRAAALAPVQRDAKPENRSEAPEHYEVEREGSGCWARASGVKAWHYDIPEAVAACWAHRDRVIATAVASAAPQIEARVRAEESTRCIRAMTTAVDFYPDDGYPLSIGYMVGKNDRRSGLWNEPEKAVADWIAKGEAVKAERDKLRSDLSTALAERDKARRIAVKLSLQAKYPSLLITTAEAQGEAVRLYGETARNLFPEGGPTE